MNLRQLRNYIEEEVTYLKENSQFYSSYIKLNDELAIVLTWEPGYTNADEPIVHHSKNKDLGLTASIRVIDNNKKPNEWDYPKESGVAITDSYVIEDDMDKDEYEALVLWLWDEYRKLNI